MSYDGNNIAVTSIHNRSNSLATTQTAHFRSINACVCASMCVWVWEKYNLRQTFKTMLNKELICPIDNIQKNIWH